MAPPTAAAGADRWVVLVLAIVVGLTGYLVDRDQQAFVAARPSAAEVPEPATAGPRPRSFTDRVVDDDASIIRTATALGRSRRGGPLPVASTILISGLMHAQPVAISTGLVRARSDRERIAPLEVRTTSGHNYFIRLLNVTEGTEELAMYIEGGRSFATDVPLGTYELVYAAGQVWYGERDRFGADTVCFKADKQFDFYQAADAINGHTIELILQVGGDLKVTRIDPSRC